MQISRRSPLSGRVRNYVVLYSSVYDARVFVAERRLNLAVAVWPRYIVHAAAWRQRRLNFNRRSATGVLSRPSRGQMATAKFVRRSATERLLRFSVAKGPRVNSNVALRRASRTNHRACHGFNTLTAQRFHVGYRRARWNRERTEMVRVLRVVFRQIVYQILLQW